MTKIRRQKRSKRYDYGRNRKKINQKQKNKMRPDVQDSTLKKEWVKNKSIEYNMESMGLCSDPNRAVTGGKAVAKRVQDKGEVPDKTAVCVELERQAAVPEAFKVKMSEPDSQYVLYMLDKYGDDYKAMARDKRNYYQDTPKQISKKIEKFRKIPDLYRTYLLLKEAGENIQTMISNAS